MDTLTEKDPQIVAIICMKHKDYHLTYVDIPFSEIRVEEGLISAGNLLFPFQFFDSINVCDEIMLNDIKKRLKI